MITKHSGTHYSCAWINSNKENDTQHNDAQHNDTQLNDNPHNYN
jgi:hypothetical protein